MNRCALSDPSCESRKLAREASAGGSDCVASVIRRSYPLVDKPLKATYRTVVGAKVPRGYFISRADAAHAMLAAFGSPATICQPLGIAY